jgi:hypothetical protein
VSGWGGAASTLATLDGSGVVVEDGPAKHPKWTLYTVAESAFTAAATTEDIELFSLPARGVIHKVVIKHTTAFSGGSLTAYTISVGIVGTLAKYAAAFDVFQATGDTVFGFNDLPDMEDLGSATSIRVAAVSTTDDVIAATAGSVDIWVLTSVLPV